MVVLLKAAKDTWLKSSEEQSSLLGADEKILFPAGQDLATLSVLPSPTSDRHVKVKFDFTALDSDKDSVAKALKDSGLNTWYLWKPDTATEGTEEGNHPKDKTVTKANSDKAENGPMWHDFKLPGFKSTFNMAKPIVPNGRLYWYEALHFDPSTKQYRPPEDSAVVTNIVNLAKFDQVVAREHLAKHFGCQPSDIGIIINSWYRDPVTNRAVGGASQSRHMWGDAVDFCVTVKGVEQSPYKINDIMEAVMRDGGLASASCFTHLDRRGWASRWSYGF